MTPTGRGRHPARFAVLAAPGWARLWQDPLRRRMGAGGGQGGGGGSDRPGAGPTAADARNVMMEGESGILAISPDPAGPLYEPGKRRLTWPNGAVATTYSADEPERLRGPQHDAAGATSSAPGAIPRPGTC